MLKRSIGSIVLILFTATLIGCASLTGSTTLTPKAQATLFMSEFKNQVADLQSISALKEKATPAQIELFKQKQAILVKMKPLIDIYVGIVEGGGTPDSTLQSSINNLINQLVATSGGVK